MHLAPVQTGEPLGDWVEIRTGVEAGETVVLRPPAKLRNGARVEIARK